MKLKCRNCGRVYDENKLDKYKVCEKCNEATPSDSTYGGSISSVDEDDGAIASIVEGTLEIASDILTGLPETYGGFSGEGGDSGGGGASDDW